MLPEEEVEIFLEEKFRGLVDEDWARRIAQTVPSAEEVAPPYEVSLGFTHEAYEPNKMIFAGANAWTIPSLTSSRISS